MYLGDVAHGLVNDYGCYSVFSQHELEKISSLDCLPSGMHP